MALLAGCDRSDPAQNPAQPAQVRVLATVFPLGDVARRVAGEHADVQWLVESGQTLDSIPGSELRDRAAQARVVITAGPADVWAVSSMSLDARATRLVRPETTGVALALYGGNSPDARAHLWLDPRTVVQCVDELQKRLAGADPPHDREYSRNARTVTESLENLDAELSRGTEAFANKKLLTVRPVWGAFCRRYGLEQVAPAQSTEERLTDDDYRALLKAAKESASHSIFVDARTPPAVRQQIAERTKLNVLTLDPLGSSAPDGLSTYEKIMRYNLEQLTRGLGQPPRQGTE